MRKILLVSGCSNTEKDFYSEIHPEMDCSYQKWPELLAEKLNMDCVNLGKSGSGNEYIYTSLLNYITENDRSRIGLVIPAWTQVQRKDYTLGSLVIKNKFLKNHKPSRKASDLKNHNWRNHRIDPDGDIFWWMKKSLNYYLSFQIMCERYSLPYMQVQMLAPYIDWLTGLPPRDLEMPLVYPYGYKHTYPGDKNEDNKKIIELINNYEDKLNTKKFIGWPLSDEYGGMSLQKTLINPEDKTWISDRDSHPNEKGHKVISEFIYERL